MKPIFVINGTAGVGKDLFVEYCSHFLSVYNVSSVDKVKEAAKILGWNGEKDELSRWFLAMLKYLSSRYNGFPYKYIADRINYFQNSNDYDIMFIHIREPEEIDEVKRNFDCKTILVKNKNIKKIETNDADANVENYDYDFYIDNSGAKEDLKQKALDLISMIIGDKENE